MQTATITLNLIQRFISREYFRLHGVRCFYFASTTLSPPLLNIGLCLWLTYMLYMFCWVTFHLDQVRFSIKTNFTKTCNCLFDWVFRPTREFFTLLETSPLPAKGCKFWPMLGTHGHGPTLYNGHLWETVTLIPYYLLPSYHYLS